MKQLTQEQADSQKLKLHDYYYEFSRDNRLKTWINSTLGCSFKAAFSDKSVHPNGNSLDYSGATLLFVKEDNSCVVFNHSEWASIHR